MVRAWVRPCMVMRPWCGCAPPDWRTLGFRPRWATSLSGLAKRSMVPIASNDRGRQPDRHHHVDAGDRHEPPHVGIGRRVARQFTLDDPEVLAQPVILAQMPRHRVLL